MTNMKAGEGWRGEQERGGSGKSMQEEKWGDAVKDRGSIVEVLTGRWQVRQV